MRQRVAELEASLMEAHLSRMALESDKGALEQALADARRQKAQLEAALIGGWDDGGAGGAGGGDDDDEYEDEDEDDDEEENGGGDEAASSPAAVAPDANGGSATN